MPAAWRVEPLASPDELDDVLAIEHASFINPWTREMYLAELCNRDVSFCYLARGASGQAVGFCSFWLVADELHINNLGVLPECRRQGVARALLTRVMADAIARGTVSATLEVRRSNTAAQELYTRLGFIVSRVRVGYYSQPVEDALVLTKDRLCET
jgi:[ribosomal protein S18]-alanine N-acetyltransferase